MFAIIPRQPSRARRHVATHRTGGTSSHLPPVHIGGSPVVSDTGPAPETLDTKLCTCAGTFAIQLRRPRDTVSITGNGAAPIMELRTALLFAATVLPLICAP